MFFSIGATDTKKQAMELSPQIPLLTLCLLILLMNLKIGRVKALKVSSKSSDLFLFLFHAA